MHGGTLLRPRRAVAVVASFVAAGGQLAGCSGNRRVLPTMVHPTVAAADQAVSSLPRQPPRSCAAAVDHSGGYGLTDISAVTGNRTLTAAENCSGTITVLRWPSPSYDNQIRYTSGLTPDSASAPNDGSFLGVVVAGSTLWLDQGFTVSQRNPDPVSDDVETEYRRPGLTVTVTDVVDATHSVLERHVTVSPAGAVTGIVGFAHFDPTVAHLPALPMDDWLLQDSTASSAAYEATTDTVSTGAPGVGLAIGFSGRTTAHQVGQDSHYSGATDHPGPADAYDAATSGTFPGSPSAPGPQVDAALVSPLDGTGSTTFLVAAGRDTATAVAALVAERHRSFGSVLTAKHDVLASWTSGCPVPASPDARVRNIARRAYISIWQATDARGPIVASIATQSPYAEDWLRDGSFINHLLDLCGHHGEVARHDLFYASVQVRAGKTSPAGTDPSVPPGNWAMNYYADGTVGGPVPWEIDETGFGTWTLVDHYRFTHDKAYLRQVYPAVKAAADFLSGPGRDAATGLSIGAREDDHLDVTDPPTMHASGPVLLALRPAAEAAAALGHTGDMRHWTARADEEAAAIGTHDHAAPGGEAWTTSYEDGGWALWPVVMEKAGSARMRAQATSVWTAVSPDFTAPAGSTTSGSYESVGLLGLAVEGQAVRDARLLDEANAGLEWIAHEEAIPGTDLLGESWEVKGGVVATGVSQPHVWEMTLFTLTALETWGPIPVTTAPSPPVTGTT